MIIDWPSLLIPMSASLPRLEKNTASGGTSLSGEERLVVNDAGRWRWRARYGIRTTTDLRLLKALMALSEGRGHIIRMPWLDTNTDPAGLYGLRPSVPNAMAAAGITYDDGALHSDDSGMTDSLVAARSAAAYAAGVTTMQLQMRAGITPEPGQFFSDSNRLYQIRTVKFISGVTFELNFRPRLRAPVLIGAEFSFDRLFCLMRVSTDEDFDGGLDLAEMTDIDLTLTEAVS